MRTVKKSTAWAGHRDIPLSRRRAGLAAAVALGAFLALLLVDGFGRGNVHTGDTEALVDGTRTALACLGDGELTGCGRPPGTVVTNVYAYPLLQYLPAGALVGLGLGDAAVARGLAAVNVLAFLGALGCIVVLGRRALAGWTPVLLAVVLCGPLLYYATAAFGEMLAGFLALLFVAMVVSGRPGAAAVTLVLACLGKEAFAPVLVGLGLACTFAPDWTGPGRRRMVAAIVGGGTAGVVMTVAFNLFRFGSPLNLFYLDGRHRVPGLRWVLSSFGGLWAAPGGGLLWFWTPAMAVLALAAVVAVRQGAATPQVRRAWLPLAVVLGLFVAFQAALALWPYPFGWIAWGPRLTVPLVPAVVVAAAYTGGAPLRAALDRCARSLPVAAAVGAVLVAGAVVHAGAVWNYPKAVRALVSPAAGCPALQSLPPPPDAGFFRCQHEVIWRWRPSFLAGPAPSDRLPARAAQVALATGLASLVVVWRTGAAHGLGGGGVQGLATEAAMRAAPAASAGRGGPASSTWGWKRWPITSAPENRTSSTPDSPTRPRRRWKTKLPSE